MLFGVAANGSGVLNNPDSGYLLCVNSKTKALTHPGTLKCPKGTQPLVLGATGKDGAPGLNGATGLNGRDGKDGKTLWSGVKDPESNWGAPGDMFINSVTMTLFGPKNLDGTWPAGVSMIGPKGDQGPSGPQGPAGATGATGATGAAAPRLFLWDSDGVKHESAEFVGSWLENYYFKIDGKIWRLNNFGSVKSFPIYYYDDSCLSPSVFITGGTGWDENQPQTIINSYFIDSANSFVYKVTGPIINTLIYSYDGVTCSPLGASYDVLKVVRVNGVTAPGAFGRFTIGP